MGRFNEIQVGRFNRALQKLLSMPGEAIIPVLATEIQPNVTFPLGSEFRYLEQWERHGVAIGVGPVAASANSIRLRNPATSNVIAVLELMNCATTTAAEVGGFIVVQGATNLDLSLIIGVAASRLDSRGRATPTLVVSTQSPGAAFGSNRLLAPAPANTTVQLIQDAIQEITLLPGDALQVTGSTANVIEVFSFFWRERLLEEYERQ